MCITVHRKPARQADRLLFSHHKIMQRVYITISICFNRAVNCSVNVLPSLHKARKMHRSWEVYLCLSVCLSVCSYVSSQKLCKGFWGNVILGGLSEKCCRLDYEGSIPSMKCVFWLPLKLLSETFLILRKIQRDIISVHRSWCKVPFFLLVFNETWIF